MGVASFTHLKVWVHSRPHDLRRAGTEHGASFTAQTVLEFRQGARRCLCSRDTAAPGPAVTTLHSGWEEQKCRTRGWLSSAACSGETGELLSAPQLALDDWLFQDDTQNYALTVSDTARGASQVGSACRAEFQFSQQRAAPVAWEAGARHRETPEHRLESSPPPSTCQGLWNHRQQGRTLPGKS